MDLPDAHAADEHDVDGFGHEATVEDLQDRVAVEVPLRLEGALGRDRATAFGPVATV